MRSNEFYKSPVIITGGGNGSGLQIVKKFLELGARVYSLDIRFKKIAIQKSKKLDQIQIDLSKTKEIIKFTNYIFKKKKKYKMYRQQRWNYLRTKFKYFRCRNILGQDI